MSYLSEYSGQLSGLVRITIVAPAGHLRLVLSALSEIPGRSLECSKHHPRDKTGLGSSDGRSSGPKMEIPA